MDAETRIRDEWLALRCQAGEPGAFEALIESLERPLLYFAIKLTGNQDRALDVLQEAWIRALRGIPKLQDPGSVRPWLYTIVRGIVVDQFRGAQARERAEESLAAMAEGTVEEPFDGSDAAAVHSALDQLDAKYREVLTLYFLEEFTVTQIASITGSPEGTVKSRLHHAKKAMKKILLRTTHAT